MDQIQVVGAEAVETKGWLKAYQWLILRRCSQLGILGLFLLGPVADLWIVKGNLSSSLTLGILPLTDPYALLQTLFAGHMAETTSVLGAVIVAVFYLLVGGRVYCGWVCPVNIVTDAAAWLQTRLKIKTPARFQRNTRFWILALTFALALITGTMVWELVNPVSVLHRGIVFGMGLGWGIVLAVFLFDLVVSQRGWCSHLCPVGAFYSLLNYASLVRVNAASRDKCDDCGDCYVICPEPQIIKPALKGEADGIGPVIDSSVCLNCGRCIDICAEDVFQFGFRWDDPIQVKKSCMVAE